jgi:hypothetical protein
MERETDVVARNVPFGWKPPVRWEPQTDSPLEILRPYWDLWILAYDLWTAWFLGLARYTSQKSGMLHHVQDRHDAGLTPWWWS